MNYKKQKVMINQRRFDWIMFDLDNTLVDFNVASRRALHDTLKAVNINLTDELYSVYKRINYTIWSEFEQNKIDAITLRTRRFDLFFEELGQTPVPAGLFSADYLKRIIDHTFVFEGVVDLLAKLHIDHRLSIITNGLKEVQRPRLQRLNLMQYFDSIIVSDEIGVAKPDAAFFKYAHQSITDKVEKSRILVVGDNIEADVQGAMNFGFEACWLHHGKSKVRNIQPSFEIEHIGEFADLIESL